MDAPPAAPEGPFPGRKRPGPPVDAGAADGPAASPGEAGQDAPPDGASSPDAVDGRTGAPRRGREAGYLPSAGQVEAGRRSAGRPSTFATPGRVASAHRAADATRGTKRPPLMRAQAALVRVALRTLRIVDAEISRCERATLDAQDTAAAGGKAADTVAIKLPDAETRWWLDVASKAVLGMTSAQLRREQLAIAAERAKRGLPAAPGDPTLPDDQLVERVLLELPEEAFAAIAAKRAAGIAPDSDRSALVLAGQPHTRADRR